MPPSQPREASGTAERAVGRWGVKPVHRSGTTPTALETGATPYLPRTASLPALAMPPRQSNELRRNRVAVPTRSAAAVARQHTAIYEAIAAGDAKKAAAAIRKHVRTVAKVRLLKWVPED